MGSDISRRLSRPRCARHPPLKRKGGANDRHLFRVLSHPVIAGLGPAIHDKIIPLRVYLRGCAAKRPRARGGQQVGPECRA